jgi:hypothetical protein
MTTSPTSGPVVPDERFAQFAGACAIAVGAAGVAYSIAFVMELRGGGRIASLAAALFLLIGGLVATPVLVAVYDRLRAFAPAVALWGLLIGVIASIGTLIHAGFDLAKVVNRPDRGLGDIPNPIDPRGLLTFGLSSIGVAIVAWLILRSGAFPRALGWLGAALSVLLMVVYLGRLIILDPENPLLLGAAALTGFLANPAWWIWLGIELRARRTVRRSDQANR